MKAERLQLQGLDRARYFMPTAICVYLFALCSVLVLTSAFLANPQNAVAVAAAGVFGLVLSGGLGCAFWRAQRRELQYTRVSTAADAAADYAAVRAAMLAAGWRIVRDEPTCRLDAQASALLLNEGERITVEFRDHEVWIASICDPRVGFSLAGRRHCTEHRERVRKALGDAQLHGG
jgi:hypothetical protein